MNKTVNMEEIDAMLGFKNEFERVTMMMELLSRLKKVKNLSWFKRLCLNRGICSLIYRDNDSQSTFIKTRLLLQLVCFKTWKDYSGDHHYPVYAPKDGETPAGQYADKFLWNPVSKYGRKRMELLDHSIEVLSNLISSHSVEVLSSLIDRGRV